MHLALDRLDRHIHLCGQPAAPMVSPSPEIGNPSGQPKNVTHRTPLTRRTGSRPFSPERACVSPPRKLRALAGTAKLAHTLHKNL